MDKQKQVKTHANITSEGSSLSRYQAVVVGSNSLAKTLYFEFCSWLSPLPGALGLLLRKVFWPRLFAHCGTGVQFGTNVVLRHPGRIRLGDNVVVSEGVVLDARNEDATEVISLGDDVMLANYVDLSAKGGTIQLGSRIGVGTYTLIQSTHVCPVVIGNDVAIGPHCYIVGGGSYNMDRLDVPIWKQGIKFDGGCRLQENVWLGAHVSVLGGVTMESGSVAATGAVVNRSMAENAVCGGVPAKVIKYRA